MMEKLSCIEAANAINGKFYGSEAAGEKNIAGVVIDSRLVKEDYLFVAIKGEKVDGHDYIEKVLANGAACVLSEKVLDGVTPYIYVDDTKQALKDLAEYYRKKLSAKIIGVTGSFGKTSTKEMLASVLSQKFCVQKTAGNFNNEIGLPLTIFTIGTEHEVAIVEMGISDFGEMHRLAKIARPDYMIITNIGSCHLENLKTLDGVLKAKTECFEEMNDEAVVFLNGDDDKLSTISAVKGRAPKFFSLTDSSQSAFASEIEGFGFLGSDCSIHLVDQTGQEKSFAVRVPLPGDHMVKNAVAASLVAMELGLSAEEIKAGIESAEAMAGRGKLIRTNQYNLIDSCYNANPGSVEAELNLLASANTRKVALLGDMLELGAEEEKLHYEVGRSGAQKAIDIMICIGRLSKNTAQGVRDTSNKDVYYFEDKASFMKEASSILEANDTILIKASNGSGFKELLEFLQK